MFHDPHHIARQARFNNCHVLNVFKDYNAKGQAQWELFIGTDATGGFREARAPGRAEMVDLARAVMAASGGFVTAVNVQRGRAMKPLGQSKGGDS